MTRLAAPLALLAGLGASGCSDDDRTVASKKEFCAAFHDLLIEFVDANPLGAVAKKKAAALDDLGVPADMPEEARHGLEVHLSTIAGLDDDATQDDWFALTYTAAEDRALNAMLDYTLDPSCSKHIEVRTPEDADPSR